MLTLVLGLVSVVFFHGVKGCPSGWVNCAKEGHPCTVTAGLEATTIAYGYDKKNLWTFHDVTNGGGKTNFKIGCDNTNFGNIDYRETKQCCFNTIYSNSSQSLDSNKWKYLCTEDKSLFPQKCAFPNSNGYSRYVKFCSDDGNEFCSYRLIDGDFYCSLETFPKAHAANNNKFKCYYFDDIFNVSTWYQCGDNKNEDHTCTLDMDTTDNNVIRATKMCLQSETNNCLYRRSFHGPEPIPAAAGADVDDPTKPDYAEGVVPCNTDYFGAGLPVGDKLCFVLSYAESTKFVGPIGSWHNVAQCDCPISETLSYGVTSTSSEATTVGWTESLSQTISESIGVTIKGYATTSTYSATATVSHSVSHTMSDSMSVSVSQSCSANCGDYGNGTYVMYQWVVTTGEYIGTSIDPFDDYSCVFFCSNSQNEPQCPPGYCKNWDCSECYPWKSDNDTNTAYLSKLGYEGWAHRIPIDEQSRAKRLAKAMDRN